MHKASKHIKEKAQPGRQIGGSESVSYNTAFSGNALTANPEHKLTIKQKGKELIQGLTTREIAFLAAAPEPVFATAMRIQRSIITRMHAGGMQAPPPIISRIFQEVSNGLLAYNNAVKMKEVPVPFAYVQFNALLLNLFNIACPIAVACFTDSLVFAIFLSTVIILAFYAIFIVANEMEDPFGVQSTDMPMLSYHEEFCEVLKVSILLELERQLDPALDAEPSSPSRDPQPLTLHSQQTHTSAVLS